MPRLRRIRNCDESTKKILRDNEKNIIKGEIGVMAVKYKLETKDDFIDYLRLIIEQMQKYMWRYKYYQKDIEKSCLAIIRGLKLELELDLPLGEVIEALYDDPEYSTIRSKAKPYPYYKYVEATERLKYVNLCILNLIGDKTKDAISFAKFRKSIDVLQKSNKGLSFSLDELSISLKEKINECYRARNLQAHLPDSRFIAQKEYRLKQIKEFHNEFGIDLTKVPKETILVNKYEYVDIEWVFSEYLQSIHNQKIYSSIFQQMRRDYTKLVGKRTVIETINNEVLPYDYSIISYNSLDMQKK